MGATAFAALALVAAGALARPPSAAAQEPSDPCALSPGDPAPGGSNLKAARITIAARNETLDPLEVAVNVLWSPYDPVSRRVDSSKSSVDSTTFTIRGTYGQRMWRTGNRNAPRGVNLVARIKMRSAGADGRQRVYSSLVCLAEGMHPYFWINYHSDALSLEFLKGGKAVPFPSGHLGVCRADKDCSFRPIQ